MLKQKGAKVLKQLQVDDVARDLLEGRMKPRDLPLVVVKFESRYYTLSLGSSFFFFCVFFSVPA